MSIREQCAAGMSSASRAALTIPVTSRSDVRRSMRVPPSSARSALSFPVPPSSPAPRVCRPNGASFARAPGVAV
eukprot:scaffold119260_cov45-Phaeocystis_antarctica.AAC.4